MKGGRRYLFEFTTRQPTPETEGAAADGNRKHTVSGFVGAPFKLGQVFSESECVAIRRLGEHGVPVNTALASPVEGYRTGIMNAIGYRSDTAWLYDKVADVVLLANEWYMFEIEGMADRLMYCEYGQGNHFGWHVDCAEPPTHTRKISITVQLSDATEYSGGVLEFAHFGEVPESRRVGTAVAFPAYLPHRVLAVTTGTRRSLVIWAHGPMLR
jgi:PKHD-type hydroxylase